MESQTYAPRVLRTATESAATDQAASPAAVATATAGAARPESHVTDALYCGQRFRALSILAEGDREGLAIEVATSIPSPRVVRVLEDLVALHGRPRALRTDNGPEFIAQSLVDWCEAHAVALHYIQPGKPDQNAYIERFNRSYRTEVLDAYAFESITQVRDLTETWLESYNRERPHDSLGRVPPLTFLPRLTSPGSLTSEC